MFVNDTMANDKCSTLDSSHFIGNNHDICNSKSSSNNDGKINKKLSNNIHGYCSENDDIKNIGTDVIDTREKCMINIINSNIYMVKIFVFFLFLLLIL